MTPPVALLKKKSRKVKQKRINAVVRWLHKRKDVKKNIKKELGKSFSGGRSNFESRGAKLFRI